VVRRHHGLRHHAAVSDPTPDDQDATSAEPTDAAVDVHDAPDDHGDGHWGVNAAIGAAAIATRTAGDLADAVGSSAPGRVVEGAARWLTRPLARQGEEVRARIEEEGVPAAQAAIRQATPGVVQAVDINEILAAIDVDALLDRIDVNRLVDRIDVGAVVAKVDVNELVSQVDVNALVSQVDVNALVSQVDVNALVSQVDVNALVSQVDVGELIGRVDLDALLASVDLDALLGRLDLGAVLERIDLNELLTRLDLDTLLASVDLAALLDRLDLNALLGKIDLDQLLAQVDINALVQRLDMDALVANTELGSIIAQSTSGVASEALDVVRSQGVGMDNFIARLANRVLRRDPAELPPGPPLLIDAHLALPAPGTGNHAVLDDTEIVDAEIVADDTTPQDEVAR
jgi:hypothetical protein